ncbi:hypothetical protein CTAYLR_005929 [Chrysophaeum taylorii]|uniref:Uncharacterized protein n=1 Tax=Chrysophaeum taylorii TaxID=2483200 RepID=A0AAD7XKG4_9STRA|nr:hypothetical protein CTAYLR_005929 [Chrysophaeum taylorii]
MQVLALLSACGVAAMKNGHPQSKKVLVAFDLDGTLLNGDHEVPARNAAKLRELCELGVVVCIASGRSGPAMYHLIQDLALPAEHTFAVAYNGAVGFRFPRGFSKLDAERKSVVFDQPLEPSCVDFLIEFGQSRGLLAQIYVGDDIFAQCKTEAHYDFARRYAALTGCEHSFVENYDGVDRDKVAKCLVMTDDPDAIAEALKAAMAARGVEATVVRGSPPFFVEVLHERVTKGAGLARLCAELGIDPGACVAFGDGDNDIEMIQAVGLGVAMKNARPNLQSVADRITQLDNNNDGVAAYLEQLQAEGHLPVPMTTTATTKTTPAVV